MLTATAVGLLCGGILGGRFRVFVLVPAHVAAILVLASVAAAGEVPAGRVLLEMLAWSLGCHGGYVAAAILRPSPERLAEDLRRPLFAPPLPPDRSGT